MFTRVGSPASGSANLIFALLTAWHRTHRGAVWPKKAPCSGCKVRGFNFSDPNQNFSVNLRSSATSAFHSPKDFTRTGRTQGLQMQMQALGRMQCFHGRPASGKRIHECMCMHSVHSQGGLDKFGQGSCPRSVCGPVHKLVLSSLNTHSAVLLCEAFLPQETKVLRVRFGFCLRTQARKLAEHGQD